MPDGNAPFCGGSGPTWNDAMMVAEVRRFQANNPNYIPGPGEPDFFGRRPPPTREELAYDARRKRRRHLTWAIICAVVSVMFFIGTLTDLSNGHPSYTPSLTIAITFAVFTSYRLFRAALVVGG